MKNCIDLNLGEVVHKSIISFHISASLLNLLTVYDFYFGFCHTANQLRCTEEQGFQELGYKKLLTLD